MTIGTEIVPCGDYAFYAVAFYDQLCRLSARQIRRTQIARCRQKVSRDPRTVAVSGVRFVCGEFHVVDLPVRFEFAKLLFVDELDDRP